MHSLRLKTELPASAKSGLPWSRVLVASLAGILLAGCAPKLATEEIFQNGIFEVRLEHGLGPDRKPVDRGYEHPAVFTDEAMDRILESVKIHYKRGLLDRAFSGKEPAVDSAFSPDEIEAMVPGFVKAFAAAAPADRIEFFFHHRRGILLTGISSGVLFVKDAKLNVIIANYRASQRLGDDNTPGVRYQDPLAKMGPQTHRLVPGPFQELHPTEGPDLEDRWLLIDTKGLLASSAPEAPAGGPKPPETLEEKLTTLKKLLDQGLINLEDYEAKKKELLKDY